MPSTSSKASELPPELRDIRHLAECDSTNDEAAAWARQAVDRAPHGAVVVADRQHKGRGRLGRSWLSPSGGNLYASFVLRPSRPPERLAGLTLAAAVACAEAVEALGAAVRIKWPNDLLLAGRKLGGILTELHASDPGNIYVIVGIGLNLSTAPAQLPSASLAELPGGPPDRDRLAASLRDRLVEMTRRFDAGGFPALRPDWERRWRHKGARLTASPPGGESVEGIAVGVDDDGALLLDVGGGAPVRITAGDAQSCRAAP